DSIMIDMLVRLYDLPDVSGVCRDLEGRGVLIRKPGAYERHLVLNWVEETFSPKWVSETKAAFARQPITCFIATLNHQVIGFACYDVTSRGFLGPMGVDPKLRMGGVGKALLVSALNSLHELGYAYGIVGGVGPEDFYKKCVGAMPIEGSSPGIYRDILPEKA
ncbi:MAG: GNAT family N-acetyltransferase, partial [Akkermansia sp.]